MRLSNGNLRAYRDDADGSWGANATKVQTGGTLGWVSTIFTVVAPNYSSMTMGQSQYSLLAYDGFYDLWSLCPYSSGQTNVVFNVSENSQDYDPNQCYRIQINIIQMR